MRNARVEPLRSEAPATARPFAVMFAAGGALALARIAVPAAPAHPGMIVAAACCCFALSGLIVVGWPQLPEWSYQPMLAAAALLTAWIIYASGDSTSVYATFYFWIAIASFYYFAEAAAAEQTVLIAFSIVLSVAAEPAARTSGPVLNWIFTTVVLAVAGALIGRLGRQRIRGLEDRVELASRTDTMTGLLNRHGFDEALRNEFERSQRTNRSFSVLVADIDGFARFNESLGAHAGDLAFEYAGAIIRRAKRRIDLAARIGEDEFALLLPETGEHAAYIVAERLRYDFRSAFASEAVPLTISIGVVNWPLHHGTSRGLLTAGEQALQLAKELGGDRSAMYGENILTRLATASARKDEDKHLVTLMSLAEAVDIRDGGTAAHCQNVGRYAAALARELGLSDEMVERVRCAGVLHDLGKIGIGDAILRKPGPLTDEEWAQMRKHPELGAHILEGTDLADIRKWVLAHHERPDGRGYPYALGPDDISVEARILAVADAFEAMTTDRVYRRGLTLGEACGRLRAGAGVQWDMGVVEAMLRLVERRDLLVATSLSVAGESSEYDDQQAHGEGGAGGGGQWLAEEVSPRSGADAIGRVQTIAVRGRLAGRDVEAIWSNGRVSGDPLVVTMVDQLVQNRELNLDDAWNFLLLMGCAVEQGTLEASGDLPDAGMLELVG
ncbi:MAG: HD domain-containing phosphohydrolase [Thermoleophilaceae bacterium]